MAKAKEINNPGSVTEFIQKLKPDFAKLIELIRKIILSADKNVGEHIKWNSPAFFYRGEMKPFDAKEYKRDIVVINIRKEMALLIFPTGAAINDTTGLLQGDFKDGRRMISFESISEVNARKKDLAKVIQLWLKQVDK